MKVRLDQLLVDRSLASNLSAAQALIGAGEVLVNETVSDKAGTKVAETSKIRIKTKRKYVSRGGIKLEQALNYFKIDVSNYICIDIGASTGGFSDCLLQNGAEKIYAVDVAYGQLAWKLRQDPRVSVLERFNARKLTKEIINADHIDFAVIDVSFISLTKILPPVIALFPEKVNIVALIKPQFELPREDIGAGGVVTNSDLHQKAIAKTEDFVKKIPLTSKGVVPSPILGPKGNREFLINIVS